MNSGHPELQQWSLCVSTLNRLSILAECVACAMQQTVLPAEVVIVDASDNWRDTETLIASVIRDASPQTTLKFLKSDKKSLPAQRNQGIANCSCEIVFLIDDDSFMLPDCAETILKLYADPLSADVVSIAANQSPTPPASSKGSHNLTVANIDERFGQARLRQKSPLISVLMTKVLMLSVAECFILFDPPRKRFRPNDTLIDDLHKINLVPTGYVPGCMMTIRRAVGVKEPFDGTLLGPASIEDRDASYRFGRHGLIVKSLDAKLYHIEAQVARTKRTVNTTLDILNTSYVARKWSERWDAHFFAVALKLMRRLFAEFCKDSLKLRLTFPQLRGALRAAYYVPLLYVRSGDQLASWYEDVQARQLGWNTAPVQASSGKMGTLEK